MTVNITAAVPTWDTLSLSDVDPWELRQVEVTEETVTVSSASFDA